MWECGATVAADGFESFADWQTLARVRVLAERVHAEGRAIHEVPALLGNRTLIERPAALTVWGAVVGATDAHRAWHWVIALNDRLPASAANATIGHELGHTFQRRPVPERAFCRPGAILSPAEQEAHAYGALWCVPRAACGAEVQDAAACYRAPVTYVRMRAALAVLLGELPGDRQAAGARLDWAMLAHHAWMRRVSAALATSECPRVLAGYQTICRLGAPPYGTERPP